MNKKNISIAVGVVLIAIVVVLLVLFNTKKDVEFDTKGGSEVKTQEVKFFGKATKPADPTREGYTFAGWYYDDLKFDFDTKITKDMTIEARWTEAGNEEGTHTITFNSDGGSSVGSIKVKDNGTITKPSDPTKEGYKFVSWQLNGKDFDFKTKVTKNMTLTAKWEKDETTTSQEATPKLSSGNFSLTVGKSKKLSVRNAKGKATWKSSNTKVATVDANGNVVAKAAGTATITATVDGKTLTVKVTVKAASQGGTTTTPENPGNDDQKPPVDDKTCANPVAVCEKYSEDQCQIKVKCSDGTYAKTGSVAMHTSLGFDQTVDVGYTVGIQLWSSGTVVSASK